ncbi:alanine--tRNA ligase [Demequina sp.]|uniref:alanine--tRNA ligase n=1 Tax=Demequina sp. TaxID=2050685 RepID=UPI003D09AF7E
MRTAEIRQRWLDYFESNGHAVVPSASLISPDPSLLFTVAGMVPFIPYMTGEQQPPWSRATSVQKCIRTPDIEEVGKTTRHGTFFQMNGNFSFGDYFKEGAITYAWDLVTGAESEGKYGFDPDDVWVTVYQDDDEAFQLWREIAGLPEERIQRRGMKDNFWSTGQPGPAGPCSEIYIDRGKDFGLDGGPVVDEDRYIEIWNLVFMQFQRGAGEKENFPILGELRQKNIDTGLGLERVAYLKQGVANMYEIDEVIPVIRKAEELSGRAYGANQTDDVWMRVVADHVRSSLMLIGDGVVPGNEGRGYVLRRLFRRSLRAMRLLGVDDSVMPELLTTSRDAMSPSYPELATDFDRISGIAYTEEDAFRRTLANGTVILDTAVAKAKSAGSKSLPGKDVFQLHDTYGFPFDLTLEMAAEQGLSIDEAGFRALMQEQKDRARADAKAKKGGHADTAVYQDLLTHGATHFRGYDELQASAQVVAIIKDGVTVPAARVGETVELVLDETPFYAESGGQDADTGTIRGQHGTLNVIDVQKPVKDLIVHTVTIEEGEIAQGDPVAAEVDVINRRDASRAHSATHLIHAAIHETLGKNANQAGSYNKPGYMRLDFSWTQPVSHETRQDIEGIANRTIRENLPVTTTVMALDEAKALGAMALFGEKYGDRVRVVEIGGPFSRELCAGTHVGSSSEIGLVSVTGEGSVGSGARRIEALVGADAFKHLAAERAIVSELSSSLKTQPGELVGRVESLVSRLAATEKKLAAFEEQAALRAAETLAAGATVISGVKAVVAVADGASGDTLRTLVLDVRARLGEGEPVVVALFNAGDRPSVVIATNGAARDKGFAAGDLVKTASQILGGGGGGKADVAQGGGTDVTKVPDAVAAIEAALAGRG